MRALCYNTCFPTWVVYSSTTGLLVNNKGMMSFKSKLIFINNVNDLQEQQKEASEAAEAEVIIRIPSVTN